MADSGGSRAETAREAGKSLYDVSLEVVMTGVAIIVPLVVTIYLLQIALGFVSDALAPVVRLLAWLGLIQAFERAELVALLIDLDLYRYVVSFLTEAVAVLVLLGIVVVVGSIAHHRYGERAIGYVDLAIAAIPGVGTVYKSFRRMGDVVLSSEAKNFQEVKLVRCLDDEMYVLGFETSSSPASVEEATGHEEMVTMFLPLAPNPVTGGFLTHVPRRRVLDVDMTIEEGVRSILTSGVGSGEQADDLAEVTMGDLEQIADLPRLHDALGREGNEEDASSADDSSGEENARG